MNKKEILRERLVEGSFYAAWGAAAAVFSVFLWRAVPSRSQQAPLMLLFAASILIGLCRGWVLRRAVSKFSDDLCGVLDTLLDGREAPEAVPYTDSFFSRIQDKLRLYYESMREGRFQSKRDKEAVQAMVSDISHQVKTPIANIRMYAELLRRPSLSEEKRGDFLAMLEAQVEKLDFLIQSLIKMSRLETGILVLNTRMFPIYDTIAQAVNDVWVKAESKGISLSVECGEDILARHDPKWTAEAIFNLLDNAVKYTAPGGSVSVRVRPWQFYIRVDVEDNGRGIGEGHLHQVFHRFYREPSSSPEEGVGLGLYLAQGIFSGQRGYISVRSRLGEGSVFSAYLPSE